MCNQEILDHRVQVGPSSKVEAAVVPLIRWYLHWVGTATAETGAITVRNMHVMILEKIGVSLWTGPYDPTHVRLWLCASTGATRCPCTLHAAVTTEWRVDGSEAPCATVYE